MVATGSDISITINSTDYSTSINNYNESGGDNTYETIRCFGNNYEQVLTGKSDYEVAFDFKVVSTVLKTLYESTTPIDITIAIGSEQSIAYHNMLPKDLKYAPEVDGIAMGTLIYSAPAYDKTNSRYNRVLS